MRLRMLKVVPLYHSTLCKVITALSDRCDHAVVASFTRLGRGTEDYPSSAPNVKRSACTLGQDRSHLSLSGSRFCCRVSVAKDEKHYGKGRLVNSRKPSPVLFERTPYLTTSGKGLPVRACFISSPIEYPRALLMPPPRTEKACPRLLVCS